MMNTESLEERNTYSVLRDKKDKKKTKCIELQLLIMLNNLNGFDMKV